MKIIKFTAKITEIKNLSENAREVTFSLPADIVENFSFIPGQFMNFFTEINGKKERRAFSLSSSVDEKDSISFCIRKGKPGGVSETFWEEKIIGKEYEVMGPIGLNTVDMFQHEKVVLLAMGVGISPVKSIVDFLLTYTEKKVVLFFGNKNEDQILYKTYFDTLQKKHENFSVQYILSEPENTAYKKTGFVQDFLHEENFEKTTVYICGIPAMAQSCREKINNTGATDVQIIEESFD